MPSSTPERQARWEGDYRAIALLKRRGYLLTEEWTWQPPIHNSDGEAWTGCTEEEADAIIYLIEEWDFGGLLNSDGVDCVPWLAKA